MNLNEINNKNNPSSSGDGFKYIIASLYLVLLCFFLMLISISKHNHKKSTEVANEVRKKFSYDYTKTENNNFVKADGEFLRVLEELKNSFNANDIKYYSQNTESLQAEIPQEFMRSKNFEQKILSLIKNKNIAVNLVFAVPYIDDANYNDATKIAGAIKSQITGLLEQNISKQNLNVNSTVYYSSGNKNLIRFVIYKNL
jgi:flagellar motor protein MotB